MNGATSINTSTLKSKTDLANLKTIIDNLDVVKIKTVSTDLSKLGNMLDNGVLKKTVYNLLVTKGYANDTKIPRTRRLVIKVQYDSDKKVLERKIADGRFYILL